jgi:hypothetical protein
MDTTEGMVVVDGKVEALIAGAVEEPIADLLDVEEGSPWCSRGRHIHEVTFWVCPS